MSTCTTTLLDFSHPGAPDQLSHSLAQPVNNTVADSSRLWSGSSDHIAQKDDNGAVPRTGTSLVPVNTAADAALTTRSGGSPEIFYDEATDADLSDADGHAMTNVKAITKGDERTGNTVEYGAGKAVRTGVFSVYHIADQFVLGLTGFSLKFWLFWGGVLLIAAYFIKQRMESRGGLFGGGGDMDMAANLYEQLHNFASDATTPINHLTV